MLAGLIFFVPLLGMAVAAGIGPRDEITPGSPGLFVLSSDAVIDKVKKAFEGRPMIRTETNPSHEQEDTLRGVFRARAVGGVPRGDVQRTSDAAWVAQRDLPDLDIEPPITDWIVEALANESVPHIA
jgi:hypothetical protein